MDPNETLTQIRELCAHALQHEHDQSSVELAILVNSLDGWLCGGGFQPNDWVMSKSRLKRLAIQQPNGATP